MARARTNPWLVLLVLTTGFFMIMLDTTIVNVAIPAMSTGLNTTLDQILWVLNAYVLVYAVLLITAGRLGDLYGQRNLFAIGLFIFTVASALCGLSQDPAQLIAARILQGVGGALLTPQTLAILTSIFPRGRCGADGPLHHLGALPGGAAGATFAVCGSQFRSRELDLRRDQLRHVEHVPAFHDLPAVGARFLGARRRFDAGTDVSYLDGHS